MPAVANGHFCCYLSNVFLVILLLLLSMPLAVELKNQTL
jgi:hypothetical protein